MLGEKEILLGLGFARNNPAYADSIKSNVSRYRVAASRKAFVENLVQTLLDDGWKLVDGTGKSLPRDNLFKKIGNDLYLCMKS